VLPVRADHGRLPDYLIVGAQKSGTTSLAHYVGAHPDAFCTEREVHYFDRFHDRGVDWYRSRFVAGAACAVVGEPTPEYLYDEAAAPRMAAVVPRARLLAVLRHPVDRAYAHYWHNRTRGHEPLEFADAVAAEPERTTGVDARTRQRFAYVDRGRYHRQIEHLLRWYPREQLHVLLTDDLRRDRAAAVAGVYRFLGLDDHEVPAATASEKNRFVEYRSQRLRPLIRRLPGPAQRVAGRVNVRYTSYPPLDDTLRRELTAVFVDDARALSAWLGRPLDEWGIAA
jgi:hypothetical protein